MGAPRRYAPDAARVNGQAGCRQRVGKRGGRAATANAGLGALKVPFSARLAGTIKQTPRAGGALVDLALRLSGAVHGRLRIRMAGAPLTTGGLSMTGSQVDLLADGSNSLLAGRIVSLQGQTFLARVADASGGALDLQANLVIDNQSSAVTGTLTATAAGGGG